MFCLSFGNVSEHAVGSGGKSKIREESYRFLADCLGQEHAEKNAVAVVLLGEPSGIWLHTHAYIYGRFSAFSVGSRKRRFKAREGWRCTLMF